MLAKFSQCLVNAVIVQVDFKLMGWSAAVVDDSGHSPGAAFRFDHFFHFSDYPTNQELIIIFC